MFSIKDILKYPKTFERLRRDITIKSMTRDFNLQNLCKTITEEQIQVK